MMMATCCCCCWNQREISPYSLGLCFLVLAVLLWDFSSALVQFIYKYAANNLLDDHNDSSSNVVVVLVSPFFFTYLGATSFLLFLPWHYYYYYGIRRRHYCCCPPSQHASISIKYSHCNSCSSLASYQNNNTTTSPMHELVELRDDHDDDDHDHDTPEPLSVTTCLEEGEEELSSKQQLPDELVVVVLPWTFRQHLWTAAKIAPAWFAANYWFNVALQKTTLASASVLTSTNGIFCLLLAVAMRVERFTYWKLVGCLLALSGTALTAYHDSITNNNSIVASSSGSLEDDVNDATQSSSSSPQQDSLAGDVYALLSGLAYAVYALQARLLCPQDESLYSMELLLGCVGIMVQVGLFPVAVWNAVGPCMGMADGTTTMTTTSTSTATSSSLDSWTENPATTTTFLTLLSLLWLRGLLDYVVSQYLCLRAIVLTGDATLVSVGLGLIVPIGFLTDWLLPLHDNAVVWSVASGTGALLVLAGFGLVNLSSSGSSSTSDSNSDSSSTTTNNNNNNSSSDPR